MDCKVTVNNENGRENVWKPFPHRHPAEGKMRFRAVFAKIALKQKLVLLFAR
jgi:hypothetical protein